MRLRELKIYFLVIMTSLSPLTMLAQEFEFSKYLLDSTSRRPLVRAKVKSVIELSTRPDGKIRTRGLYFDKMGRLEESYFPDYFPKLTKVTYEYYQHGELKKQSYFDQKDTTKLIEWKDFEYNSEGHLVKEKITNTEAQGTSHSEVTKYDKPISENQKTITKQIRTNASFIETILIIDSTINEIQFRIFIKYSESPSSAPNNLLSQQKTITRTFIKNNIEYKDLAMFSINNRQSELTRFIRTSTLLDNQKRKIEVIKANYTEANPKRSGDENPAYAINRWTENMIALSKANENSVFEIIDNRTFNPKITEKINYSYNENDLLQEMITFKGGQEITKRYTYDSKQQLIEIKTITKRTQYSGVTESFTKRTVYTYNDRELISSESNFGVKIGTVEEVLLDKTNYVFEFYD